MPPPLDDDRKSDCQVYRPDHNGECLTCDEWADAHTPEALAAGEALAQRTHGPVSGRHAKLAQDTWLLIRALGDPEVGKANLLNRDDDFHTAAMNLIEMACDSAAEGERLRRPKGA